MLRNILIVNNKTVERIENFLLEAMTKSATKKTSLSDDLSISVMDMMF
jgi:hypothetical protein